MAGSPLARLFGILYRPSGTAQGLASDRHSWIVPLLLLALCIWLPAQHPQIRQMQIEEQRDRVEQISDRGLLPAEQSAEMLARLDRQEAATIKQRVGQFAVAAASLGLLRLLFPALLLWVGLRHVMEGQARFLAVVSVLAYSAIPAGIRALLRGLLQLARGSLDVHFSPAILTGTESVGGFALDQLDLFDLWILALLIPALAAIGSVTRGRAAGLVLPLWGVYSLLKIAFRASPFGVGL
jgi:hypothetical protein